MSVASTTTSVAYTGDGTTVNFSITFGFDDNDDIQVIKRTISDDTETVLTQGVDFTITGGDPGTTVHMLAAPSSSYSLYIYRLTAKLQPTDLLTAGASPNDTLEDVFDHICFQMQEIQREVARAVKLQITKGPSNFDPTFPKGLVGLVSAMPTTNASGTAWAATADWVTVAELAADVAAAAASAAAALTSQSAASASATAAASSATAAASSASSASSSATAAAASATAAAASAATAANGVPGVTGTRASPTAVVAANGIAFSGSYWVNTAYVQGSGGAVDISKNPQIAAPTNVGQCIRVVGCSDTNTILLENGTGLIMNGSALLGADDMIDFEFDGTNWRENGRNF